MRRPAGREGFRWRTIAEVGANADCGAGTQPGNGPSKRWSVHAAPRSGEGSDGRATARWRPSLHAVWRRFLPGTAALPPMGRKRDTTIEQLSDIAVERSAEPIDDFKLRVLRAAL